MYSRRSLLVGIAIGERLLASDFWDRKPPSQWSPEEIDRLITKSPWAKQAPEEYLSDPLAECSGGKEMLYAGQLAL